MSSEPTSLRGLTLMVQTGTLRPQWPHLGVERVPTVMLSLLGALASYGNPSFFEFERQEPAYQRLGGGVSRVSDSFWPVSERWM